MAFLGSEHDDPKWFSDDDDDDDDDDDECYMSDHARRATSTASRVWTTGINDKMTGSGTVMCDAWQDHLVELRYKFGKNLVFDLTHSNDNGIDKCKFEMRQRTWTDLFLFK